MTQLRVYKHATIEFNDEDVAALSVLMTRSNADGDIVEYPPDFPLTKAQVVFNGDKASISIPQTNKKHRRVISLHEAKLTEPKRATDPIVVEGTAHELRVQGFDIDTARVRATITKYATCATCR
jgi:hypothetical protein